VALLLNVYSAGQAGAPDGPPLMRIVVIKPRLTASAPADVRQYGALHPNFRRKAPPTSSSTKRSGKVIARWA
jgi:hypothetical protein